jgi:hypothetical protein
LQIRVDGIFHAQIICPCRAELRKKCAVANSLPHD